MGVFFQYFVFALVLLGLGRAMFRSLQARAPFFKLLTLLSGTLATIGVVSFLGGGMFANGIVKASPLLNWPAGYAHHVVTTGDGSHVVGLENVGRVQVYSPSWVFLRGWQVPAEGGNFTIVASLPNRLDVYTARSKNFVTYAEDGTLIGAQHYEQEFAELPQGPSEWVPTPWYLLPFSSPFGSWGLAVIGAGGMELLRRFAPRLS